MNQDQIFGLAVTLMLCGVLPAILVVGIPLGKAWARRWETRFPRDEGTGAELEQLRSRVAELEERVDFAERLLARGHEPADLGKE